MDFIKKLKKLGACSGGVEWAGTQSSAQEMWNNCERGDWMLWLCGKLSGEVGSDSRKKLVWTACQCARLALKYIANGEYRSMLAIEIAEKYCGGKATLGDVKSVSYAADAANAAAAYAVVDAYATNAAYAVADAAHAAATDADAADAARKEALKQCADIVREYYPVCPLEERSE